MSPQHRNPTAILALFLIFSLTQIYAGASIFKPRINTKETIKRQELGQAVAKLITTRNQPVMVNGNRASTGRTILTGATIEVPKGVAADIDLGPQGDVFLAPETKVSLNFDSGNVAVNLIQGGVRLDLKKGTTGVVNTAKGRAGITDPGRDSSLDIYFLLGSDGPIVDRDAAFKAVAEIWDRSQECETCQECMTCRKFLGLCWYLTTAIIGGSSVVLITTVHKRGRNPSPMSPSRQL